MYFYHSIRYIDSHFKTEINNDRCNIGSQWSMWYANKIGVGAIKIDRLHWNKCVIDMCYCSNKSTKLLESIREVSIEHMRKVCMLATLNRFIQHFIAIKSHNMKWLEWNMIHCMGFDGANNKTDFYIFCTDSYDQRFRMYWSIRKNGTVVQVLIDAVC